VQSNFDTAVFEMVHWCYALDSLNHAGGNGGKQQFCRIECIQSASYVGVESDLGILAASCAAMGINALCYDIILKHLAPRRAAKIRAYQPITRPLRGMLI
jgi:hypothetical protein